MRNLIVKAPEKIYINSNLESRIWLIGKGNTFLLSTPRTDAFVEKACDWIKMMWSETDDRFNEDYTGMLIENFKNYIKGE